MSVGCGGDEGALPTPEAPTWSLGCDEKAAATTSASCIVSFEPGVDAGFGQEQMPDVIYGDPIGNGDTAGSLDVLSLGRFGSITLGFGSNTIVDLPGPDFVVFENPFFASGNKDNVFAELAEVSVSDDGKTWTTFSCEKAAKPPVGCAGYAPVFANADLNISAYDPAVSGGDMFDLGDLGVTSARFVRIKDLEGKGGAPSAGFDLDAITILHGSAP